MAEGPEARVAGWLLDGMEALRKDQPDRAVAALIQVCGDPDLAAAPDLADIRARAFALLTDAHLRRGEVEAADASCREALALARTLQDAAGVAEVQGLWARVTQARTAAADETRRRASSERLRGLDLPSLRARFGHDPAKLADVLIKKSNAESDAGGFQVALEAAEEALALARGAGSVREEVFALLSVARAAPDRAQAAFLDAWTRAERASEFNLVGAVARAADASGIQLPKQVGPDLGPRLKNKPHPDDDPTGPMR